MQVPLWRKTAISSCTEIMDKEFHAWLSESLCRDFFLYEITFFYVFDLCITFSSIINECMQKSESDNHQKERVQFKDQDFLARFSCIIEITLCEKFHRKKNFLIWYETAGSKRVKYLSLKLYQRTLQGKWGGFRPYLQPSQSGTTTNFEGVPFLAFS